MDTLYILSNFIGLKEMGMSPSKLNKFLMFKLPAAWLTGVRVRCTKDNKCVVIVKHRWINQNPFKSMFWAVQGMAAELTTGVLVMMAIKKSGRKVSMLVLNNNSSFSKKATGKITFICNEGHLANEAVDEVVNTEEGKTFWMQSVGIDEAGDTVSTFNFEWTVKLKG